ncbi:MAG: TSUP family transporter [Alphaproteobacteria bacterium]
MQTAFLILISALLTACVSGIFGMAGGLIFMGIILTFLSVEAAMVVHGTVQGMSNSYRSWLLKENIRWDILGFELIGSAPAIGILALAAFVPEKGVLFLVLGAIPLLLWLPKGWLQGDAQKPRHAMFCGFLVMSLNLVAGVAGPALDFFYVRTALTRQEIVSTKAVTMFASHIVKIGFFGIPLLLTSGLSTLPPLWVLAAAAPCVMIGTFTGTRIMHRMSDVNFRAYTKYLVTFIGAIYLYRGMALLGWL